MFNVYNIPESFFTDRQYQILQARLEGDLLTKTEGEYLSRVIKKKLKTIDAKWAKDILIKLNR